MESFIENRLNEFNSKLIRYDNSTFELAIQFEPTTIQKRMFALINSIYPEAELGQTVLDSDADPEFVDDVVNHSNELLKLNEEHLARRRSGIQSWMVSGRATSPGPSLQKFNTPTDPSDSWAGKPAKSAIFTSVASPEDLGMWFLYVITHEHIYTRPWFAWNLEIEEKAKQLIVDSSMDWCSFVCRFPRQGISGVSVNWVAAAEEYDAIHITPKAVASIDSIEFNWHGKVIEASFWSVETTVWLRWKFRAGKQITLPAEPTA
ncbi:hypothetical protein [Arthrobacter dokdonensis]|uniref:hypothetical protein n=1 Tax=Arthrobacter dokdonellae TaxID=2211210 RepID=UPI001013CA03|nr:hypothetical protein [Arthrobacter dokdonellae]